jgi:hypothetical protein
VLTSESGLLSLTSSVPHVLVDDQSEKIDDQTSKIDDPSFQKDDPSFQKDGQS